MNETYGVVIGILAVVAFIGFIQYRSKKAKARSGSSPTPTPGPKGGFKDDSDN